MNLPTEVRPWGSFTVLLDEADHKVKTITVNPNSQLSLQRHSKRAESWTCVSGMLWVRLGRSIDELHTILLYPGNNIIIPRGYIHRASAYDEAAVFIEVQTGTYFGEDDIERFEDDYGRSI